MTKRKMTNKKLPAAERREAQRLWHKLPGGIPYRPHAMKKMGLEPKRDADHHAGRLSHRPAEDGD